MDALSGKPAQTSHLEISLDRRRFLILVAGGVSYLALRPALVWARRRTGRPSLQPWSLPEAPPGNPVELARALIGAAILAPNHWNSQPWLFEVEGSSIRLIADTRRSMPAGDPDQRQMMMSLGAALENLLVAARAYGLRPKVTYFPHGPGTLVADVSWTIGDTRRDRGLFHAIPDRRTNRRDYDGRGIFPQNRARLLAQASDGISLHWLDDRRAIREIADLAHTAVAARWEDVASQAERYAWMRFGDDDARRRGDGVTVDALEFNGPAKWMARRYFSPRSWMHGLGAQSAAKQARSAIRSSGALMLLSSARTGEAQWLLAGQAYERFALAATQLGIAHQPVNELLAWERSRNEIVGRFDAAGQEPLMLVRLGHAKRPAPSMRRAVALVSSFRNS